MINNTLNTSHFPWRCSIAVLLTLWLSGALASELLLPGEYDEDQIEIIEGENRTIYEYRQNGVLTMIKIVPEKGRPYYLVPADGAPHFESLDHKRKLYPQWVIVEW
ncbi:MAG: DUF2782 domain-containing protein [Gammaproteobacteria bacterium]|jgi:hypothetical protein|nr:DUF2782 domain-containing protein [Gammaproteobacteria bacterium]MBT4494630.1 DUF2782 domain-containing protein [Gammaproteobacteria bacterium]MBT7369755.1 DUF2782 domain-containing protein [Gammaproteobacteria bacterium]